MADTSSFDFFAPASDAASSPAGAPAVQPKFQDIFGEVPSEQLDPDPLGLVTESEGIKRGTGWTRDTVEGLNLYGQFVTTDELRGLDGGLNLIDLAARKRQGRRGFTEAVTTGSATDFIPYVGDLASTGIAIKNMKVVRDAFKKMSEQGPQALTLQEKVLTKLYQEDMERQSNQTFGGTVGTILRQAPAFAGEFLLTGGLFKAGSKALGMAAKETAEELVEKSVKNSVKKLAVDKMRNAGATRAALDFTDDIAKLSKGVFDDAVKGGATAAKATELMNIAEKSAQATAMAYKNPSQFKNFVEFVGEYGRRGLFDHMDDVVRDLPPGTLGKLREAAGVAFVEAPVKGFLYSAFDFMAVNPAVASVMGADEAVTKTELGLYSSGDKELMDNAKMLAFGTAWAEYASEGAGRAFTALGGIVEEAAGQVGRRVARSGLRARADFVQEGSIAKRLYDYTIGTESELKAGLASIKQEAVEAAVKANSAAVAGKTVGQVLADTDLTDKVMKNYLGFRDKSFLGYWVANKALEKNITPQAVTRLLENMGYDDILGEFMEERYNGFAQGLFGLDGQEHDSNIERIAHAVKSAVPEFQQGLAEIVAFSVPTIARAATSRAYEFIGAGQHGKFSKAAEAIDNLGNVQGLHINREGKPTKYIDIRRADAGTGSTVSVFAEKAGKVAGSGEYMPSLDIAAESLVDAIPTYTNAREDKVGLGLGVARAVLGIANTIITGNPIAAFHNPLKALARQKLGEGGARLLNSAADIQKALYVRELARRAGKTAQEIEASGEAAKLTEAGFNDPSILEAIRPDLKNNMRYLVKEHLRTRGTIIVEDQDVDAYLDEQMKMKSEDGKLAGLTREEFRDKFFDELAGSAAGRMTMDIVNGRVNTTYRKPAAILDETSFASVAASVEEFLNQQHISSFMHGSEVSSPDAVRRNLSGTPIDVSDLELAVGTGQDRNSAEVDRARMRLVMKMYPNPDFAASGNWEYYMSKAAHTAAVLLEAHKGLMRPQFEMGGQRVEVKGGVGDFYLGEALGDGKVAGTASYATIEEAVAAAQALGAKPAKAQMYFTSSNTFVTANAATLLSNEVGSRGYLLKDREFDHSANPFMKLPHAEAKKQVEAELALAAAWDNRKQTPFKNAADETAAKAAYDKALGENGYETLARKAAEKAGIKRYGTPDQRGEQGFIFEPAAISTGGSVFISYARMGSTAAIIEDAFETAVKRNLPLFVDPRVSKDADGKMRNSPVVRAMMEACQNELRVLIDDESQPQRVRAEAVYLSDLFDPEPYNLEAVSHAATAFVFYQGDAARTSGSGSALYATLGIISKRIRGNTAVYDSFASLVNRAAGGGMLTPDGGVLSGMVKSFLAPNLRDVPGTVRPVVQGEPDFTPISDLGRAAEAVADDVRIALEGTPRSGFLSKYGTQAQKNEQAFYKSEMARLRQSAVAGGNVREYLDEELPFLLEEIKGARNAAMLERGRDVIVNEEKTKEQRDAEAAEAAASLHKEKLGGEPGASSASMATDMLENHPAFAIRLAEEWMSRKPVSATDKRDRFDQVFDEWMLHDPLLSDDDRRRFLAAATEAGLMDSVKPAADLGSDPTFGSAFDAMFGLDETYDEGETQNTVAELDDEGGENLPSSADESNFKQDAVARDLENDMHVTLLRGVIHTGLPAAQRNDQEALEMLFDMSSEMYAKGSKDANSVASLFDERMWTAGGVHPALVDEESFREWLEADRPEKGDPMFDDLISAMRVIGLSGVFKAADKMKGSYVKAVYSIDTVVRADGRHVSVEFRPRSQSMSAEVSESLLRASKSGAHDPAAAIKMLDAEAAQGLPGRLARLADAAELMFGKHNFLSQTLRKTKVRDMVTRRVVTEADKTYNTLFNSYGKIAPAGLVALRLLNAAKLLSEGKRDAAKLLSEGKQDEAKLLLERKQGEAVRELMRGDALAQGDSGNRGGVPAFLNDAAGLIPVSSATRMGEAAGKVRAIDAAMSAGQIEFLMSKEFADAYVAAGGDAATLERAIRFGKWADGTPVFAAVSGISRRTDSEDGEEVERDEIANPMYDEAASLAEQDYNSASPTVKVAIYNSEKDMERLVTIPRVALSAITGMEKPAYLDTLKAVSRLMRVSELSPKRGAHHMAGGAAIEIQNAEVALMLVGDTAARENMHGVGYIGSPELAGYYRRQGFGSAAKVILTESPTAGGYTFFSKGQFILADTDAPDGAVTQAEKDIRRIAKDYAYLSDMDSFKETALYYKAADGRKVMDLILAGENAVTVKLPDGTEKSVSDIAAELGARVTEERVNGNPVTILSIRMGLRSQWASAPSKLAEPKHVEVPVNYAMDNKEMWAALNKQASVKAALAARVKPALLEKIYAGLPDPVKRLVDAGVGKLDPDIMKTLGPKLASAFTKAFKPSMFGVQYLNRNFDGARALEGADDEPYVSDPLGGMDVLGKGLIHDTYVMEDGTRRLASTAVNLGGMTSRYGMRVVPSALGVADGDIAGIMEAVETRVRLLKAAELRSLAEGDESIYLRAYAEHIDGVFTDGSGNPLMPGQILSFSDLVDRDGKFDSTRLYESSDESGAFVFLNGQINISGRTPSRDGKRAEYAHVAAMPAYMEEADGSQFYLALSADRDGNLVGKRVQYPISTEQNPVLVPGRDAVLKMTPMAKRLAGSDEDWDKSHSQRMPTDRLGRERIGINNAEQNIRDAVTDEEAEQIADQAIAGLESEGFWAAVKAHRNLDPMTNPVTATPFTKDYQDKMIPKKPNPKLDTIEAAAFAAQNKEAQVSRAISVSVLGNLVAAIDTGMLFSKPIPGSVLRKPEGAKAAYWDGGFAVGPGVPWTPARIRTFISAASGIANSTFDDLKESLAARAGFRPEFLDLYLYLGFESGVETQEAYEQFHTAFMEWMNGPEGLMVSEAFRNAKYPAKYGGSRLSARLKATSMDLYSAADSESGDEYHYQYFRNLSMPHRDLVTALALANGGGVKGFDAVFPTVLALDRLRLINAVGNVLAYKKANLAFPEKVEAMDRRIDTVLQILNNKKIGANFSAFGREAVVGAVTAASAMSAQARAALKGTVELSPLYIAAIEGGFTGSNKAMSGGMRVQKAVKRSINTRLPFEAAVRMTPASTGAKIDAIRAAEQPGRKTAGFLSAVETVLKELYRGYAKMKGKPNAALDTLLAPGTGSKATRIMTVGSDGTAAAAAELRASMEAMRDWTTADKSLPVASLTVDKKPMQITPADFYWMLLQYSCLTVEKSVETGRATQSLISAFFGPAVYRKLSDYQIAEMDSIRGVERLLEFTRSNTQDYKGTIVRKRALNGIPAAMEQDASLKWGSYDEYMKSTAAEEAKPASVEETPAPEAVKPAPVVAADPVAAEAVTHTPESAAWKNAREQAKAVAAMTHEKNQRRLFDFARRGAAEPARMTDAMEAAAGEMGRALTGMAELPWLAAVPGHADTLRAADAILAAMRFPEPAVFAGAVRALGRAAVAADAKDAVPQLAQLIKAAGVETDDARLDGIIADSAKVLSDPAAVRVMEFAVASDGKVSKAYAKVTTRALARGILAKLGVPERAGEAASASMASIEEMQAEVKEMGKEIGRAKKRITAAKVRMAGSANDIEAKRRISQTGERWIELAQEQIDSDVKLIEDLNARIGMLSRAQNEKKGVIKEAQEAKPAALPAALDPGSPSVKTGRDKEKQAAMEAAPLVPKAVQMEFDLAPKLASASMAAAEELAEIIRKADAAIGKADYADKYAQRAFPNNKILRKRLVTPESVAARVPAFLGTQPDGRKLLFGHVTGAIRDIEAMKGLGKAKNAMLYTLGVFFKPATNQTVGQDFETFNGKRYGEFMGAVGNSQARAADALLDARKAAESLSGPDKKAALANVEKAERAFFSALLLARSAAVALRPRVNKATNPLRAQIAALENERITPPANLPPDERTPAQQVEDHIAEVSLIDPDTGHPDPSDDFRVTFVSSDEWFYGTVFPNFRGADIRDILFDKEALAILPAAIAMSNRFEAYLGTDSDTGSLRRITRAKGMGNHLADGGYVFDGDSAADVMVMGRRKIVREQADILSGNAFDDNEFALARWFGNAVWHYMGDGGMKAKQALAGEVKFDLKWSEGAEKLGELVSYAEAKRRVGGTGENRPYAVHELLIRAKESLPAELFSYAETALREAVVTGARAAGNKSQAALKALEQAGFAVARRREIKDAAGAVTGTELYDVRLAIPVSLTARVFASSTAHGKLVKNGRVAEELTIEANAALLKGSFAKIDASVNAMGWAVNGDARLFSDAGSGVPFFKGSGAYQYFARKLDKPAPPEYTAAVTKAYESLRDMFPKMRRTTRDGDRPLTGAEAAQSDSFARMFNLLRDLHPQTFGEASTPQAVWQSITVGRASGLGLDASSTAWDIAKAVYAGSVAKLHESAWLGGTVQATDVFTVGLEAFNRAIGEAAEQQNVDLGRTGATFSEIYDHTGALPQNLTAGEALALHARQVAEMTRYRGAVNQMLMTSGEDGMPLVYARPGLNQADDTVPDRMWGMLARWWAETGSDSQGRTVAYDESLSGRKNAERIFDLVTPGMESEDAVQTPVGGLRRYILSDVKVPSGMESFSAVKARKDPAGDDTKARMNAFGGGEAANVVRQVFAIAGYGRPDLRLAGMNRALSWSKSASVMASLFFPIATAFESPVAAVGFWSTALGLTKTGAGAARWMQENQGWIAKAFGVNDIAQAPFMADILKVIGSDDPALTDLKVHATLSGLNLADRAHNMTDTDRTVLAQDIAWVTAQARALHGVKAAKSLKAMLEGAMEHSSEFAFEYIINATKMAVFAQMNNRLRQKAIAAGRWWDPVRDMKKWANYINAEVGGIDPAMYPWMTPKMQQILKATMFSWEWTLGAWEAGGGGVLTQKLFGQTTAPHLQKFMFGRWLRMYGSIMIGLPVAMQMIITAVAKAAGEGDDDDKWFSGQNERGRGWKDFDITPMLRTIANTPVIPFTKFTWGDLKKKEIPLISALIPALTGQEGDQPTTRKRRYYMHMGKQGWEVAGWFENPTGSFLSKMSMPAQKILEGVLGITPSMGWEKPFAELSFWERWTSLDPEKSALLNLGSAFAPFSLQGARRNPEIGALAAIGPTGKGMSKTRAEKEMARMFESWGDAESYIAMRKGKPGAWTDLTGMATEWLEALRLNGYDPETSLKNALAAARKPLYEQIHNALPAFPDGKADTKELEAAARGLYRLDFVAKNLMKSIKARDKAQHIKRSGELGDITDALLRDAFENPYGRKADGRLRRSAAGGGDVRKLLASDKVPRTVLGYRVLKTEELSEDDRLFFDREPSSPGFFKLTGEN